MLGIVLNRDSGRSLHCQLTVALRTAVMKKSLEPGDRLPPSRQMAGELGVSRNLVTAAYDQLISEGYLNGEVGRGTFVSALSPRSVSLKGKGRIPVEHSAVVPVRNERIRYDFFPGRPDLGMVPRNHWLECQRDVINTGNAELFGYGDAAGESLLRREIASYLFRVRGIEISHEDVLVTGGTAESMVLLSLSGLGGPGSPFRCENPSVPFCREGFLRAGWLPVELDTDDEGPGTPLDSKPGGILYLNPSHRFPRGGQISAGRRRDLLEWALSSGAWVIEDDYDAEFRYSGMPLEPMVNIAPEQVIYSGTFSKSLFPDLRVGYLLLPAALRASVLSARESLMLRSPDLVQKALGRFLERGYLDRHLKKMKRIYMNRERIIEDAFLSHFGDDVIISPPGTGYHLSLQFPGRVFDRSFFDACRTTGIGIKGEGHYSFDKKIATDRLVMGFGNASDELLDEGLRKLMSIIDRDADSSF